MLPWPDLPDLHVSLRTIGSEASQIRDWASTAISIGAGGISAVLGGFAGAYLSERFAARRRQADQLTRHKLSAFTLQLQLMGIYTDLVQFREHLGQSRVAIRANLPGRRFRAQSHQAFSGEQSEVHFRVEDLQALASYGSSDLLNVIADLDRRFNVIAAALNQYRVAWLEVGSLIEGDLQGDVVVMSLSDQDLRKLGPKFATLSKMLFDLDPMVDEMVEDTYKAMVGLYQARVQALGQAATFEAIDPNGHLVQVLPDKSAEAPKPKPLAQR